MSAMTQIPEFYPTMFSANWRTLAQQKPSKLSPLVVHEMVSGKEKKINQAGPSTPQRVVGRAQETRISDLNLYGRWLSPYPYDDAKLFDEWDEDLLGEVTRPDSTVLAQMIAGFNRAKDGAILAAAVGSARTGTDGTGATTLPAGQQVAVNYTGTTPANIGLTLAKVLQAKYLLDVADVEDEGRILVCSAKQLQDMLNVTEVKSADYNSVKALVNGQIDTYLGFKFVRVSASLLPYVASTDVRSVVAFQRDGIAFTEKGAKTRMDIRADLSHALQIRSVDLFGATRTEEVRVVEVFCDESP